jgi:hypothetical protein
MSKREGKVPLRKTAALSSTGCREKKKELSQQQSRTDERKNRNRGFAHFGGRLLAFKGPG